MREYDKGRLVNVFATPLKNRMHPESAIFLRSGAECESRECGNRH